MSAPSLPSTQSAYQHTVGGGVDKLELLRDLSVPSAGRGEVLVRVRAVSLNYRDLMLAKGLYPFPSLPKTVSVSDAAGEVVAVGEGVSQWKVGDRVTAGFQPFWTAGDNRHGTAYSGSLGGDIPGVLTQYRSFPASALVRVPSNLSFAEASTLPCAGVTAWNALHHGLHPVRADHSVLVQGTGGVSIFAAQIARAAGARVIATSSSDAKLARLVQLGLIREGDGINYKTTPEWGKKAKELTGGIGVDHVVEVGGQGTISQSIAAVRPDGEIAVIGVLSGDQKVAIDPYAVLKGGFAMRGIFVGSVEQLRELAEALASNAQPLYKPVVDKEFAFKDAKEAYKYLESGAHFGKIVINVD